MSEEAFRRDAPSARFIHVAAHGLTSSKLPLNSAPVLAKSSGPDGEDGCSAGGREILGLDLTADLGGLAAGKRKDVALRDAMKAVAANPRTAHPHDCASWQLHGDGGGWAPARGPR